MDNCTVSEDYRIFKKKVSAGIMISSRLKKSLIISSAIHGVLFLLFFDFNPVGDTPEAVTTERKIGLDSVSTAPWQDSTVSFDSLFSLLCDTILCDTILVDSLHTADSVSLLMNFLATDSLQQLFWPRWRRNLSPQQYRALAAWLRRYASQENGDSIVGMLEGFRRTMHNRIRRTLDSTENRVDNIAQWKEIIDRLASSLKLRNNRQERTRANSQTTDRLLQDSLLMNLWQKSLLYSLQEAAMQRLREIVQEALLSAAGSYRRQSQSRQRSGSTDASDANGRTPYGATDFNTLFSAALQAAGSRNYSYLTSFFDKNELFSTLGTEAFQMAGHLLSGIGMIAGQNLRLDSSAISSVIAKAFAADKSAPFSSDRITAFLQALDQGFGQEMAEFMDYASQDQSARLYPYRLNQWASDYMELIDRMVAMPNLMMPNLDAYGEAARKARQRLLPPQTFSLSSGLVQRPPVPHIPEEKFFSPEKILLNHPAGQPAENQRSSPLNAAPFYTSAWGGAVRARQPIRIDGQLNEWAESSGYGLLGSPQGAAALPSHLQKLSNKLMMQWDNRGLYCAYHTDDRSDNAGQVETFWDADCLELFFDPRNSKDSIRIEKRSYQFWVWPRVANQAAAVGQSLFLTPDLFKPMLLKKGVIAYASVRKGNAYTVEAFVPSYLFERWHPLPGAIIGFNYSINNGEGILIRWVTDRGKHESVHPNLWGDLLLMGSDAKLQVWPADFIVPGQTIRITVTDPDMNLQYDRRDNLWMKVGSHLTGDQLAVELTETTENSGVFQASAATLLALKPKELHRLSTRPGDRISVYYLDLYGSGNKRNTALNHPLQVARAIFSFTSISAIKNKQ
ncbi:MAG: hypothetical protein JW795_00380 [Chitinivibrionales bacterium]|nr:hypothetical protein [Chitinivibrionales bacterium]